MSIREFISTKSQEIAKKFEEQEISIGGFTAGVRISETISLESDTPDSPLEDGSLANDHIINKPVIISFTGTVGDIDLKATPFFDFFIKVNQNVGSVSSLLPARTQAQISRLQAQAISAYEISQRFAGLAKAGNQVLDLFSPNSNLPIIDQFFSAINRVRETKTLIDIETRFGVYHNMAVISTSLPRVINESLELTYTIRAKEFVFAETILTEVDKNKKNPSEGLGGQSQNLADKGVNKGADVKQSIATSILGIF